MALIALLAFLSQSPGFTQLPTIDPHTVRSASGRAELFVDPTDRSGAGPGLHRVALDGALLWERELPFTLYEAAVANDGAVIGVAYTEGLIAWGGELLVVRIGPGGGVTILASEQRAVAHPCGQCQPFCEGVCVLEGRRRALVRIHGRIEDTYDESWWLFDLDGERPRETVWPSKTLGFNVRDVAAFQAARGLVVASLSGPDQAIGLTILGADLGIRTSSVCRLKSDESFVGFETSPDGQVSLQLMSSRRVTLELSEKGGLRFREEVVAESAPTAGPPLELELIERASIGVPPSHDKLLAWDVRRDGDVEQLWSIEGERVVIRSGPPGSVRSRESAAGSASLPSRLADQAWLEGEFSGSPASIPVTGGAVEKDGRALRKVGPSGREVWRVEELFPRVLTETSRGEIWGLNDDEFFALSATGGVLRRIPIQALLGQPVNYASRLCADDHGGALFEDFGGDPQLWHLRPDGTARAVPELRLEDGRAPRSLAHSARVGSDGKIWAHHGDSILRFDDAGRVELRLGQVADPSRLTSVGALGVTRDGLLAVFDEVTGTLHMVDPSGAAVHRWSAPAGPLDDGCEGHAILEDGDGDLWISGREVRGSEGTYGWAVFGPDGEARTEELRSGEVAFAGTTRFVAGHESYELCMPEQSPRRVERLENGRWVESPGLVQAPPSCVLMQSRGTVSALGPDGSVVDSWRVSPEGTWLWGYGLAARGDLLAKTEGEVLMIRRWRDSAWAEAVLRLPPGSDPRALLPPGRDEIWVVDQASLELLRFRLPERFSN